MPIGAGLIYSPSCPAIKKWVLQAQLDLRLLVWPRRAPQLPQRQPQPAHRHRRPEQHPAQEKTQEEKKSEEENPRVVATLLLVPCFCPEPVLANDRFASRETTRIHTSSARWQSLEGKPSGKHRFDELSWQALCPEPVLVNSSLSKKKTR